MAGLAAAPALSLWDPRVARAAPNPALGFHFTDVTTSAGIHFLHNSGAFGGKLLPETLG